MLLPEDEINAIRKELKTLYNRVDQCTEKVDKVGETTLATSKDMHDVLLILQGNPRNKDDNGIIGLVVQNSKRIDKLERFVDRVIWFVIGASLLGGYAISDIIDKIVK